MDSEAAVEVEKATPEPHESSPRDDPEEEEQLTPEPEEKRGSKRESPEKEDGEPEDDDEGSAKKRPSRERKMVERYSALSPRKPSASKALSIEQGPGTKLKDIPNVAFKLSKRKVDENLQALHAILFGRKSTAHFLKRNILQFSGFVWSTNEEKQKAKVREKIDKYTKDKLVDFCELLDINFKVSTKKEEISAKLLEFLECPHVTRELLLADKEKKGKKRRSSTKVTRAVAGDASSDKETKKRKKRLEKGQQETTKPEVEVENDEDSVGSEGSKHPSSGEDVTDLQESDHANHEEEENKEEPQVSNKVSDDALTEDVAEPKVEQKTTPIKKSSSERSDKSPSKRFSKKIDPPVEDEPEKKAIMEHATSVKNDDKKKSSRKSASLPASESGPSKCSNSKGEDKMKDRSKEKAVVEEKNAKKKEDKPDRKTKKKEDKPEKKAKKQEDKPEKKAKKQEDKPEKKSKTQDKPEKNVKKQEDKSVRKVSTKKQGKARTTADPSREELHSVLSNILREVDFNTATLADILKKLGTHFNKDLMDRKAEVKGIIEDVINNMTDDEDADENEDGDSEREDEKEESDEDGE